MEIFKNRPLARICAVFVMASILFVAADAVIKFIVLAAVVTAAILWFFASLFVHSLKRHRITVVLCAVAVVAALLLAYLRVDAKYAKLAAYEDKTVELTAQVSEIVYENSYRGAYIVDVTSLNGEDVSFAALCNTEFAIDLSVGDEIRAVAQLMNTASALTSDEEEYYFSKGVLAVIEPSDTNDISVTGNRGGAKTYLAKLGARVSARIFVSMEDAGGDHGMTSALFVGDVGELDEKIYRDFKYIGASHLLAVSGMHLSILIGGIEAVLRRLTLHRTPRTLLLIALTVIYMGLTGFSSAVIRAGVMLIIYYLSYFSRREPDRVTSLFVSVTFIVLATPFAAAEVGLLLSFSAMLACVCTTEMTLPRKIAGKLTEFAAKSKISRFIVSSIKQLYGNVVTALAALVFTLPVMWLSFGRVSLLSPISTLLLSAPTSLILYLAPFVLLTFRVPWLSAAVSVPCAWLCRSSGYLASSLASLRGFELALPSDSFLGITFCSVLVVCVTMVMACRKRTATISGSLTIVMLFTLIIGVASYRAIDDSNSVTYVKVGKNEAFAITDGTSLLVCDVTEGRGNAISATVEKAGEQLANEIDVYMLTHLHYRHARAVRLLCDGEYVNELLIPLPETEEDEINFNAICNAADECGVPVRMYKRGDVITFGDVSIKTESAYIGRSTHPVILLSVMSEGERTTYVGSSVHESEIYDIAADLCQASDNVIFGVHGPVYKSGTGYGIFKDTSVLYANWDVVGYMQKLNDTDEWDVYNE